MAPWTSIVSPLSKVIVHPVKACIAYLFLACVGMYSIDFAFGDCGDGSGTEQLLFPRLIRLTQRITSDTWVRMTFISLLHCRLSCNAISAKFHLEDCGTLLVNDTPAQFLNITRIVILRRERALFLFHIKSHLMCLVN